MKVVHLVGFYPEIGGPFSVVKTLCTKLSQKGMKIKVLSPIPKGYDKSKLSFVEKLPFEVEYVEEQLPRYIWPSFSFKFIKKIKEESADLLHVAMPFDFYNIAAWASGRRFIISLHGTFMKEAYSMIKFKKFKKDIYMRLIGKKILRKAELVHLLTNEEKRHFLEFYPDFVEKIRVIPNGIDISELDVDVSTEKQKLLSKYPNLENKKIVLFLSRLNWKKGLDLLIPAFSKLCRERHDVHLLIVGKDDGDGYEQKVRSWIRQYGIQNRVTFAGLLTEKDKIAAFKIADVFVLPSYSEGLPTAVIEAMACKIPVVVSNKVGITQEIQENNAGLIVNTKIEDIYQGINNLIENELLRKVISNNGRIMVERYYNIGIIAEKVIDMYEEVLRRDHLKAKFS